MDNTPAIWLVGSAEARQGGAALAEALAPDAKVVSLGPPGEPEPDLDLGAVPDLAVALMGAPMSLRPAAAVWLGGGPLPEGWPGLPCPLLGWGDGARADGVEEWLPAEPAEAARAIIEAAGRGRRFAWLAAVQVNLPLRDLLGRYRPLLERTAINPEVGIDCLALDMLGESDLREADGLLAGRRLTVHLPFMDLCPGSLDRKLAKTSTERLEAAAAWAIRFGAKQAVCHLGYQAGIHRDIEAFAGRFGRRTKYLARMLDEAGIGLALENTFEPGPRLLVDCRRALAEESGVQAGFCLDLGHARAFSQSDLPTWWEALAPHLMEMHLHDNDGLDDSHLPPGRGGHDWSDLGRRLAALPQLPVLTLEPHAEPHLWESLRALERLWGPPEQLTAKGKQASVG